MAMGYEFWHLFLKVQKEVKINPSIKNKPVR